jgi:hypothetical protein
VRIAGVLQGRLRLARAAFRRSSASGTARPAWVDLVLVALLGAVMVHGTGIVFDRLARQGVAAAEAGTVLGVILVSAFGALALFEVHLALTTLVLDSDLELLRVAPLTSTQLLGIKLIDAAPATGALFAVFAIPAILSFGRVYGLPPWAWIAIPPLLLGLWAVPLGIGMALSLLLLRAVPPRIVRETLGVASTLTVTVVLVVNAFVMPRVADDAHTVAHSLVMVGQRLSELERWLPPLWATRALVLAHASDFAPAAARIAMVIAAGVISFALLAWVARHSLDPVMSRLVAVHGRGRGRGDAVQRIGRARIATGSFGALVRRDLRLFVREWPVLSDVALAALLWPMAALVLPRMEEGAGSVVFRTMMLVLAVGSGMELATRSVPLEREAVIWNRLAGIPPRRWAMAKALACVILALPVLAIAVAVLGSILEVSRSDWMRIPVVTLPALALSIAIGLWIGTRFAERSWTHPRAMIRLGGRLLAAILVLAQVAAWLIGSLMTGDGPLILALPVVALALLVPVLMAAADCLDGQLEGVKFSGLKPRN